MVLNLRPKPPQKPVEPAESPESPQKSVRSIWRPGPVSEAFLRGKDVTPEEVLAEVNRHHEQVSFCLNHGNHYSLTVLAWRMSEALKKKQADRFFEAMQAYWSRVGVSAELAHTKERDWG